MKREITERQKMAQAIRAHMARARLSRQDLARRAGLAGSTIDRLLDGRYSEKTLLQVETALGHSFSAAPGPGSIAPEPYGSYSRADAERYLGSYVLVRPSFAGDGAIHAFAMELKWDETIPALLLTEQRAGVVPAQLGHVHIPHGSMHVFIQSNELGWLKQVIVSRLDVYNCMRGVMLTMGDVFANIYMPVVVPVALRKCEAISPDMIGKLRPGTEYYDACRADLAAVEKEQYARWIGMPPAGGGAKPVGRMAMAS